MKSIQSMTVRNNLCCSLATRGQSSFESFHLRSVIFWSSDTLPMNAFARCVICLLYVRRLLGFAAHALWCISVSLLWCILSWSALVNYWCEILVSPGWRALGRHKNNNFPFIYFPSASHVCVHPCCACVCLLAVCQCLMEGRGESSSLIAVIQ